MLDFDEVIYTAYGSNYDPDLSSPMQCGSAYDTDAFTSQDWYGDRKSNLELAKKYLDASDYNGEELQLIVSMSAVSAVILEDLQSIGINCDRQSLDNQTMIAYANDGSLDWDIIVRANPISYIYPTEMNSTFYNNWHNQQGEALMETLGTMPTGSAESVACWQELASLMAEEVPFVIFGGQYEYDIMSPGLVPNRQGNWRVWYNAYWTE